MKKTLKSLSKVFNENTLVILLQTFNDKKLKQISKIINYCKIESENLNEISDGLNPEMLDRFHYIKYIKYKHTTPISVALELICDLYSALEYQSNHNMNKEKLKNVFDNFQGDIMNIQRVDLHIGCFSYPNCDIDPNGCGYQRHEDEVEPYGHRD